MNTLDREMLRNNSSKDALDWIGESFLNAVDAFLPGSKLYSNTEGTLIIINTYGWISLSFFNACLVLGSFSLMSRR